MTMQNPERVVTKQDLKDFYDGIYPYLGGGGGGSSTVLTQTLAVGSTSVTFSNIPTTGDNIINFYTSTGINYTSINTATAGVVTLTFDEQEVVVTVYCEIKGV